MWVLAAPRRTPTAATPTCTRWAYYTYYTYYTFYTYYTSHTSYTYYTYCTYCTYYTYCTYCTYCTCYTYYPQVGSAVNFIVVVTANLKLLLSMNSHTRPALSCPNPS